MTSTAVFGVATDSAWEVVETLWRLGADVICIDNLGHADQDLPGLTDALGDHAGNVVVGPGMPRTRLATAREAVASGARRMDQVVDPHAVVSSTARLAHGVYVSALGRVGALSVLGCLVKVNALGLVAHHCDLGAFTAVGPGGVLCGGVRTGPGVFIGAGAVVLPDVAVGDRAIVGAGAVVTKDVPAGVVVAGNPARVTGEAPAWETDARCPLCEAIGPGSSDPRMEMRKDL